MGMLDELLGGLTGVSGGTQQAQSPILQMALQLIQQNGGLPGIISKFQQAGLGDQAQSWVGTGQNMPISTDQLSNVLGGDSIGALARQFGFSPSNTSSGLAQALPQIVDRMTPHGQVPEDHSDMLAQALSMLTKRTA